MRCVYDRLNRRSSSITISLTLVRDRIRRTSEAVGGSSFVLGPGFRDSRRKEDRDGLTGGASVGYIVMLTITSGPTMRAAVHDRYGDPDVLRIDEVPRPVPAADEVLVEVHTATVNRTDCGFRLPRPFFVRFFSGLRRPKYRILGTEFAGVVVERGAEVTGFDIGDRVFGVNERFGANAEFMCVRHDVSIATMPAERSFAEMAAVTDGGILAMTCMNWSGLSAGQRILIYGASGAIGTSAVQLAKQLGAHVTAVCGTASVDMVAFARPRRRRRLPAHRLHGDRRDVRRGVRRGRQVVVPSLSVARAAGRPVRVDRPRVHVAERVPVAAHPEVRADADPDAAAQVHAGQGGAAAFVGRVGRLPGRHRPFVPARPDRRRHGATWRRSRSRATC